MQRYDFAAGFARAFVSALLLIGFTAFAQQITVTGVVTSSADGYISKPFSEKVLLARIGNLLKSRILLKEHYLETGESASRRGALGFSGKNL